MDRRIAKIGLVIFLVGVVLLVVGAYGAGTSLHPVDHFAQTTPGKYVSAELNLTSAATVTIQHLPSTMGLINAANLSLVNASTLATYGIPPTATSGATTAFLVDAGSYFVVYFGSSPPTATVDYLYTDTAVAFGFATLIGLALAVAGGITGIIGVVKKPKTPPPPTSSHSPPSYP